MKLSEIRAKFPQYDDLPDEQLVIGLRKKYYADIPMAEFSKAIEYDNAPDPTEGMSAFDRGAAGAGKAIVDTVRGAGQWLGLTDRADVAESRKRDAALMNTTAGMVGNIGGNLALLAPTAFAPGAATLPGAAVIGAISGALQPSVSTKETLQNTALSAALAPASIMAVRGAQGLYQGAKGLVEPLTRSGQDRIAARVLQSSATDPARAAQMAGRSRELVPGSRPTLAQVAQDPGLAQLERTILNNPEYAPALQARLGNQRAARLEAVKNVAGRGDYYDDIKAGRALFAGEDYGRAMAEGVDQQMAKAIAPQIESLMGRPSIQSAQRDAIRLARESGVELTDFGSLQGMDWLKKALDNQISRAATPGSSIGKADLKALVQTKNDLMQTLEQIAPAYKTANDNFAQMSKQVNSMDVARDLMGRLNKPGSEYMQNGTGKEMGDAYMRALSLSKDSVKKATGMKGAIDDVMNPADIAALENVARDIGRKTFAENAGKATGSNTAQNLASQNMLRRMLGPTGLPESWAESTMLQSLLSPVQGASRFVGADQRIMNRLAQAMLDPLDGVGMLTAQQQQNAISQMLSKRAQMAAPIGTLGISNATGNR
jgi:hypothetical protein